MRHLLTILTLLTFTGCADVAYHKIMPDGTRVDAGARSWFSNTALHGFNADSTSGKTTTGLKVSTSDTSPDNEALKTLFEGIGTAAGIAAKTAVTR